MNCKVCQTALPDLLLDPAAAGNDSARAHLAECTACAHELASLEATFALLDTWEAPAVSPYFDQKLAVRIREEQRAPAAGFFENLRSRLIFNTGRHFRPLVVGSFALLLLAGGGSIGVLDWTHVSQRAHLVSPAVNDLQILENNQQALQQMDQLLQDNGSPDDNSDAPQS